MELDFGTPASSIAGFKYLTALKEYCQKEISLDLFFVVDYKKFFIDLDEEHITSFFEFIGRHNNKFTDRIRKYTALNKSLVLEHNQTWKY
jgi:hypothetical protein